MTYCQDRHSPRLDPSSCFATTLRVLALFGLFLLPIQMRAGTNYVHPHALLHLLLDGSDQEIDHHRAELAPQRGHGVHGDHTRGGATTSPDQPTLESIQIAAGGLAVMLVTVTLFLRASSVESIWPRGGEWRGRRERPELPPPRLRGV